MFGFLLQLIIILLLFFLKEVTGHSVEVVIFLLAIATSNIVKPAWFFLVTYALQHPLTKSLEKQFELPYV